jgi:hypothetical protein
VDSTEEGQTVYLGSLSTCLDPHFPFLALLHCAKKSFSLLLGQTSYSLVMWGVAGPVTACDAHSNIVHGDLFYLSLKNFFINFSAQSSIALHEEQIRERKIVDEQVQNTCDKLPQYNIAAAPTDG